MRAHARLPDFTPAAAMLAAIFALFGATVGWPEANLNGLTRCIRRLEDLVRAALLDAAKRSAGPVHGAPNTAGWAEAPAAPGRKAPSRVKRARLRAYRPQLVVRLSPPERKHAGAAPSRRTVGGEGPPLQAGPPEAGLSGFDRGRLGARLRRAARAARLIARMTCIQAVLDADPEKLERRVARLAVRLAAPRPRPPGARGPILRLTAPRVAPPPRPPRDRAADPDPPDRGPKIRRLA